MNAPAQVAILNSRFESIPVECIRVSMTQRQQQRRKTFDATALLELAVSIQAQGVLQPILVHPVKPEGTTKFEIVAGERRWIAASRAGLKHIDCNVREFSDAQVLEAQLVENLQREDDHPLEEAIGFRELLDHQVLDADAIGTRIGKSRAYVYARLKLLDLCAEARAALDAGTIDASKALLIARLKGDKLQKQALTRLQNSAHYSYQMAATTLRNDFMVDLAAAPFDRADGTYFEMIKIKRGQEECSPLPACEACPHYSQNDAELQASFDADAHVCTNKLCFDTKRALFYTRRREAAEEAGQIVLTGAAAKAAIPENFYGMNADFVDLDAKCDEDEFPEPEPKDDDSPEWDAWASRQEAWEQRTYRQLLAKTLKDRPLTLAQDVKGTLHELLPVKDAVKLLKAEGIKLQVMAPQREISETQTIDRREEEAKQEQRQARERTLRRRVLSEIHRKWKGPLKQPELARLAELILDIEGADDLIVELCGSDDLRVSDMNELEVTRLLVLLSVMRCLNHLGDSPAPLYALAKRFKIDPAKIKKDIAAGEKAAAKAAKAEK